MLLLVACLVDCSRSAPKPRKEQPSAAAANSADAPPPAFLRFPRAGSAVEPWVQEQVELAEAAHLRVLVYVGASWCEPCQRFHQAVEHGELNGPLNGLRFLEFDQDQDASALKTAGYVYQYIPVLALPDPDGRNHGRDDLRLSQRPARSAGEPSPALASLARRTSRGRRAARRRGGSRPAASLAMLN